jgi:hypothetical protein
MHFLTLMIRLMWSIWFSNFKCQCGRRINGSQNFSLLFWAGWLAHFVKDDFMMLLISHSNLFIMCRAVHKNVQFFMQHTCSGLLLIPKRNEWCWLSAILEYPKILARDTLEITLHTLFLDFSHCVCCTAIATQEWASYDPAAKILRGNWREECYTERKKEITKDKKGN